MKRLSIVILPFTLVCRLLYAEINLSGQTEISLQVFPIIPYTSDRFDNPPINPDNIYGIHDVAVDTDVTFKLAAGEEASTLTLWLSLDPYDLSQLLLAAAFGDTDQQLAVGEGLPSSDPAALSILRANIAWYIGQMFVLRVGRQSMFTGYGYGWNPMDFANTVKDPFDPEAELRGVDALSLLVYIGNLFSLKVAGLFRFEDYTGGVDFNDVQAAADLSCSLPSVEVRLTGFFDHDSVQGEDAFVPALGAGCMLDLAGIGIYGEAALLWGSRTWFPKGVSTLERKDEVLFSGLLGLEYTFPSELKVIAEYFYNGEGYSRSERKLCEESLEYQFKASGYMYIPGEYVSMYRRGYFSRQYLLVNLGYPIYAWNTNTELSAYFSPDSWALGIIPSVELEVSGGLSIRGSYMALISLRADQYDEARLSPLKHVVELGATHFY